VNSCITKLDVGAGAIRSIAVDSSSIYIGTDFGLGLKYQLTNLDNLFQIFLIPGASLESVILDSNRGVTYWGTAKVNNLVSCCFHAKTTIFIIKIKQFSCLE
jgi:hypothetical protein